MFSTHALKPWSVAKLCSPILTFVVHLDATTFVDALIELILNVLCSNGHRLAKNLACHGLSVDYKSKLVGKHLTSSQS